MIGFITVINLSAIDLNLMHILAVTLEERSATRAAKKLGVTQSAVSNALARARDLIGDPLLVRDGRAMTPTPVAQDLLPELMGAMNTLRGALNRDRSFDPCSSTRQLTLACADNSQIADVPPLAARMAREMPRARLRVVSVDYLIAAGGLASSEIDVALGVRASQPGVHLELLYKDPTVAVVRKGHPVVRDRLTRAAFPRLNFIDVHLALGRPGMGHSIVDQGFRAQGLVRRVGLVVPGFVAAAMAAAATDLVACMPMRVARALAAHLPIRIAQQPVADLGVEIFLGWHERTHSDPAAAYLRGLILDALSAERCALSAAH